MNKGNSEIAALSKSTATQCYSTHNLILFLCFSLIGKDGPENRTQYYFLVGSTFYKRFCSPHQAAAYNCPSSNLHLPLASLIPTRVRAPFFSRWH